MSEKKANKLFYSSDLKAFLQDDKDKIVGVLTSSAAKAGLYQQKHAQTKAWFHQIDILKDQLSRFEGLNWRILLEYAIPRRAKRPDVILLSSQYIYVLEFKVHSDKHYKFDIAQVEDYTLDLRDFHKESHGKTIVPILVATDAPKHENSLSTLDDVYSTQLCNKGDVGERIEIIESDLSGKDIDVDSWENSAYEPTPTIIEAARHIYAKKDVDEITRHHAGSNLVRTTEFVLQQRTKAQEEKKKVICFVTGVPGAGKTLVGLDIAHHDGIDIGTFLSGNVPLIQVLTETLSRDHKSREGGTIAEARRNVTAFIGMAHVFFKDYGMSDKRLPPEKTVVFDEAQRAWNAHQARRKFDRYCSEPEMMLEIMDRHKDWCFLICLIGGGQEINTGETGLTEWGDVLREKFSHWKILISPELLSGSHAIGGKKLFEHRPTHLDIHENPALHLNVDMRSYKAEQLSLFVSHLLEVNLPEASDMYPAIHENYPIYITRDIEAAKNYLRTKMRGTRRGGIFATAGARRLRPLGIDPTSKIDVVKWFLGDADDVRSSSFLELAANEFAVQGLELDWSIVCWGGDFRFINDNWSYFAFKGSKWQSVHKDSVQEFILNKYRVLLTRAREGIVIFVPPESRDDKTRQGTYDGVFSYLKRGIGIKELPTS